MNKNIPTWLDPLEPEDFNFIKRFILTSGSLKAIATEYGVTYPTVRLKLNKLIEKIKIHDKKNNDSYVELIKELAMNDQIDFDAAKILINEYRKENGGN